MKQAELVRRIRQRAAERQIAWEVAREGGRHTVYRLGNIMIPVPRHTEIDDRLAEQIFKECEEELGSRWWRR